MSSRKCHSLIVITLCLVMLLSIGSKIYAQGANAPKQLIFSATPTPKGVEYKIGDVVVSDPLRGLGKAVERYGDEIPVLCIIDSRLPMLVVSNAIANAGKAGFKNVRSFALDHDTKKVSEVKFGRWTTLERN